MVGDLVAETCSRGAIWPPFCFFALVSAGLLVLLTLVLTASAAACQRAAP